jgi:hypothetical protein
MFTATPSETERSEIIRVRLASTHFSKSVRVSISKSMSLCAHGGVGRGSVTVSPHVTPHVCRLPNINT